MELNFATCQIISRFLLPVILLFVAIIRQNLFSGLYFLLFFLSPLFPSQKKGKSQSLAYIKVVLITSTIICLSHIIFQCYLAINSSFNTSLKDCELSWTLLKIIGLHRLNNLSALNIARLFIVDFILFGLSLGFFILAKKIYQVSTQRLQEKLVENEDLTNSEGVYETDKDFHNNYQMPIDPNNAATAEKKFKFWKFIQLTKYLLEILFLVLLGGSAILNPSVLSLIYFLNLIFILTWFGANKKFTTFYIYLRISICVFIFCHLMALFIYQIDEVNNSLPTDNFYARLFGLTQYSNSTCTPFYQIETKVLNWNIYAHPVFLCVLYLTAVFMIKYHFKSKEKKLIYEATNIAYDDRNNTSSNEKNNGLNSTDEANQQTQKKLNLDDLVQKENSPKLTNRKKIKTSTVPSSPFVFNTLQFIDFERLTKFNLFLNILNLIKKGSYVGTLIIMMTWSITYHSWMGFVLLIASCIIWMMPNSREACLKSSVFLIVYAIFLLISQYFFSLNLDEELPTHFKGINLVEIGFKKEPYDLAYKTLFIKLLYSLVFYITLRQHMEEKFVKNIENVNLDQNITEAISFTEERHMSLAANYDTLQIDPVLNKTIKGVNVFLSKYWIIIVTLLLMVMSLSGKKVVLFRVVYMSLFLAFVLVFQISYKLWRKFIYLFWLIVIIYSMGVLVAIYTYQFKDFKDYWKNYLFISYDWQKSIGLEEFKHDPLLLFNQLFTPTFFIIITIIQVHFFHKKFLKFSNLQQNDEFYLSNSTQATSETSFNISQSEKKSREMSLDSSSNFSDVKIEINLKEFKPKDQKNYNSIDENNSTFIDEAKQKKPKKEKSKKLNKEFLVEEITSESPLFGITAESLNEIILPAILRAYEIFWRILELHLMKVVFIVTIIAGLDEVSLANFVFIVLVTIGLPMKKFERIICHSLVIWSSILILMKMFYQLSVVQNVKWLSSCSVVYGTPNNTNLYPPFDKEIDNRIYIGFNATDNIFNFIFKYLIIVLVLSLHNLVYIRQTIVRLKRKEHKPKTDTLFDDIHRKEADTSFLNCLKFFINYWFYKFGLEFIAVFLVFAIAARKDLIAFIFSLFLILITLLKRKTIRKMWPLILFFHAFLLPVQYLLILGLPIGFCVEYPWSAFYLDPTIRKWLFLSDYQVSLDQNLLIYDFFILLFFSRQYFAFKKEKQINLATNISFINESGGSNTELNDENYSTTDPNIKDYFSASGKSFLDVLKTFFFSCFYWITLAVLFITANNRQNLFGLGYIIGCFVFLWNGNDFYLKTRSKVFKNWKYLIFYTSFVIMIKTILFLIGCELAESLFTNYCALAKLFGIGCDNKLVCKQTSPTVIIEEKDLESLSRECLKNSFHGSSLFWDAICLMFLIIQKRIFGSYYFNYLVIEVKAQQRLASRGAELIHEIQAKEYKEEKEEEKELMEKIKAKMDLIRANQRRTLGSNIYKPKHHYQACRSGDYYMVDNPEAEILDSEEKEKRSFIPDPIGDELKKYAEIRGLTAFCSNLVKGSFFEASPENTYHVGDSSKDSAIISIDRSEQKSSLSLKTRVTNLSEEYQPLPSTSLGINSEIDASKKSNLHKDQFKDDDEQSAKNKNDQNQLNEKKNRESIFFKIKKWIKIIKYFFVSCLISSTVKLNEVSRDYRYVSRRLAVEKKALKCIIHLKATPEAQKQLAEKISNARVPEIKTKTKKQKNTEVVDCDLESSKKIGTLSKEEDLSELADYYLDYNVLMRFFFAICYAIISQSEILCYFCVILNQMKNSSLISLPLPLMVFLWGCFSLPRPSKTFWISLITYTEAIVVAKYMFQFKVWEWTNFDNIPPNWPNIFKNIENINTNSSSYDLFLLLVLFFHRFMLKSLGLWDIDLIISRFDSGENNKLNSSNKTNKEIDKVNLKNNDVLENQVLRQRKIANKNNELEINNQSLENQGIQKQNSEENFNKEINESNNYYLAFFLPFHDFFNQLFILSEFRIAKDFYAKMFLCDFINFFIVVFGYSSFGSSNAEPSDITTYFREDRVPILLLVMLLIQFLFIIIDRALYLKKNIFGRLIFHILIVVIIHIWLFFVIPIYTQRNFTASLAPQFWYISKTMYLLLSANQIKSGYPTRILGNCFTKKYTLLNLYLFKIYMAIPFLYDLRIIMDWIWTESSLDLNEWAIMEDIFKQLFERKCEINYNDKFPYPRGEGRKRRSKFIMGGFYFMIVVIAIWFPLTLFAFGSQVGTPTKPVEVAINLEFSGFQSIFEMSANQNSLSDLNSEAWTNLQARFPPSSSQFLSYYNKEDVIVAKINGNSFATWDISPPNKEALIDSLKNDDVIVKLTWKIKRKKKSQNMDVEIFNEREIILAKNETFKLIREKLAEMLINEEGSVVIPELFPNSIRIPGKDEPKVISELQFPLSTNHSIKSEYRDINITLNKQNNYWWTVSEIDDPYKFIGVSTTEDVVLLLFNDRVFPDSLQFLSGYGILGLYSTFVFVVSRIIRGFFDDLSFKVIYTQLPCVRKVLQLCLDIYLVRESGEFELEEDLYAKLIFLYRSPETLIKWTRNSENLEKITDHAVKD